MNYSMSFDFLCNIQCYRKVYHLEVIQFLRSTFRVETGDKTTEGKYKKALDALKTMPMHFHRLSNYED